MEFTVEKYKYTIRMLDMAAREIETCGWRQATEPKSDGESLTMQEALFRAFLQTGAKYGVFPIDSIEFNGFLCQLISHYATNGIDPRIWHEQSGRTAHEVIDALDLTGRAIRTNMFLGGRFDDFTD
jgi:hypothetical protein